MAKQQTALMSARELASLRTKPGDSAEDETETFLFLQSAYKATYFAF